MALSKEAQKSLLKKLKYDDEQIKDLVDTDDEKSVDVPETLKIYTEDEFTVISNNLKEQNKSNHIKAGKEIAIKELKEKSGVEFDGKDPETFISKIKEKAVEEAKIPANDQKLQWETEKKALQGKITDAEGKVTALENEKKSLTFDSTLRGKLPADRKKAFSDDDHLMLTKSRLGIKQENGKTFYEYKGKRLQDDKMNDLDLDAAIGHIYTEEKWREDGEGGAGGGASRPAGGGGGSKPTVFKNMTELKAHLKSQGIDEASAEATQAARAAKQANPAFDSFA